MASWDWLAAAGAKVGLNLLKRQLDDGQKLAKKHPSMKDITEVTVLIADDPKVQLAAADLLKTSGFGFAKESVVAAQSNMNSPHKWHRPVIKKLGKYLDPPSKAAMRMAYGLIAMEDKARGIEGLADLRKASDAYYRKHTSFRKRVYNICRSGYVQEIIFELAWDLEEQGLPHHEIRDSIQTAFNEAIWMNPLNIFVNEVMSDEELVGILNVRLIQERKPLVRVYARGRNVPRVVGTTNLFADGNSLRWHKADERIGRSTAACCRIWNPEFGENFPELERAVEASLREEHGASKDWK